MLLDEEAVRIVAAELGADFEAPLDTKCTLCAPLYEQAKRIVQALQERSMKNAA
jgi:hypothetical protein